MSHEWYLAGVSLTGVVLLVVGLVLAIRGRADAAPHHARLGPLRITSPGPGMAVMALGAVLVVSRLIWSDGTVPEPTDRTGQPQPSPGLDASPEDVATPSTTPPDDPGASDPVTGDGGTPGVRHELRAGIGAIDLDRALPVAFPEAYDHGELSFVPPGELVPLGTAPFAVGDASSLASCADALARYTDPGISTGELQVGASFCMETSEGAVAGVSVAPWDGEEPQIELTWWLWGP